MDIINSLYHSNYNQYGTGSCKTSLKGLEEIPQFLVSPQSFYSHAYHKLRRHQKTSSYGLTKVIDLAMLGRLKTWLAILRELEMGTNFNWILHPTPPQPKKHFVLIFSSATTFSSALPCNPFFRWIPVIKVLWAGWCWCLTGLFFTHQDVKITALRQNIFIELNFGGFFSSNEPQMHLPIIKWAIFKVQLFSKL